MQWSHQCIAGALELHFLQCSMDQPKANAGTVFPPPGHSIPDVLDKSPCESRLKSTLWCYSNREKTITNVSCGVALSWLGFLLDWAREGNCEFYSSNDLWHWKWLNKKRTCLKELELGRIFNPKGYVQLNWYKYRYILHYNKYLHVKTHTATISHLFKLLLYTSHGFHRAK